MCVQRKKLIIYLTQVKKLITMRYVMGYFELLLSHCDMKLTPFFDDQNHRCEHIQYQHCAWCRWPFVVDRILTLFVPLLTALNENLCFPASLRLKSSVKLMFKYPIHYSYDCCKIHWFLSYLWGISTVVTIIIITKNEDKNMEILSHFWRIYEESNRSYSVKSKELNSNNGLTTRILL